MKKYLRLLLLLALFPLFCHGQEKVAVYVTGDDIEESLKKVFGSKLVSAITKSNDYMAYERTEDFLNSLTDEQIFQTDQIIAFSKKLGAQKVAAIDVVSLFGELFVSSRLLDVNTAEVISSFEDSGPVNNMDQLSALANKIADGLILEPARKIQDEKDKKKAEEDAKIRDARLRQQAIHNLTPPGSTIFGNYAVLNTAIPVHFSIYDNKIEVRIDSYNVPAGFTMANAYIIEYLIREGMNMFKNTIIITSRNMYQGDKIGNEKCWWCMDVFWNGKFITGTSTGINEVLFTTIKGNKPKKIIEERLFPVCALFYRDAPSEEAIQREVTRLKKLSK